MDSELRVVGDRIREQQRPKNKNTKNGWWENGWNNWVALDYVERKRRAMRFKKPRPGRKAHRPCKPYWVWRGEKNSIYIKP